MTFSSCRCWCSLIGLLACFGCGGKPAGDETSSPSGASSSPRLSLQNADVAGDGGSAAQEIFNRRILPIFNSKEPSSCTECHLAAVELRDYIRPDQAETFAALWAAELIDVDQPENSKVLEFIRRAPAKGSLVSRKVRQEELQAFTAWLQAAVKEPALLAANGERAAGPSVPLEVVRHARTDRVLQSFVDNVWSEVLRCAACHSPDRNQKQVEKFGDQVSWITLDDPQATMDYLLEAKIINLDSPAKSRLLTKPTLQEEHGGGQKLMIGDRTYRQFLRFIEDYAATRGGEHRNAADLPAASDEVSQASDLWLKLSGVPKRFDKMLLRADVFRWDAERGDWSPERCATADRAVFGPNQLWQNHLTLTVPRDRAAELRSGSTLPEGRYQVKVYVDQRGKLAQDAAAELSEADLVAQMEFRSRWPAGYGQMTEVGFGEE